VRSIMVVQCYLSRYDPSGEQIVDIRYLKV